MTAPLRIAAIIPGLPEPADRGTFKRYRAMIRALAQLGEVDCVCLVDEPITTEQQTAFAQRVHRLHVAPITLQPWKSLAKQCLDTLAPNVRHWFDGSQVAGMQSFFIGDYDAVFIGDLVSIPYAQAIGLDRFPMIIDRGRVDSEFQRQQDAFASEQSLGLRIKRSVRRLLTKRFERSANTLLSEQIVCAPSDKVALERVSARAHPFQSSQTASPSMNSRSRPLAENNTIMLPGAMDYRPNIEGAQWFVDHVWPLIRRAKPEAQLHIVGRTPYPRFRPGTARMVSPLLAAFPACCRGTSRPKP